MGQLLECASVRTGNVNVVPPAREQGGQKQLRLQLRQLHHVPSLQNMSFLIQTFWATHKSIRFFFTPHIFSAHVLSLSGDGFQTGTPKQLTNIRYDEDEIFCAKMLS